MGELLLRDKFYSTLNPQNNHLLYTSYFFKSTEILYNIENLTEAGDQTENIFYTRLK